MTTEEILALIAVGGVVGTFLNPVISFLKTFFGLEEGEQTETKRRLKFVLSLVTSILGGILTAAIAGKIAYDSLVNILISVGIVFTASAAVYNLYWKGSKPEERAEDLGYVGVGRK